MEQILAVDGGGTKCEALLMNAEGEAQAFAAIYPDQPVSGEWGRGRSSQAALAAIRTVLRDIKPAAKLHFVAGNGAVTYQFLSEFKVRQVILWHAKEWQSALAAAGEDHGLVALAGTGAFGHLSTDQGDWHADSYGPLLGDWGGAYQIGREGLRAAMRSTVNPELKTGLFEGVVKAMGFAMDDKDLMGRVIYEGVRIFPDRTAVAGFAKVVDAEARRGDAIARTILLGAAGELADNLEALARRGAGRMDALPFIGIGGVIQHSDLYWGRLCERAAGFLPGGRPRRIDFPQSVGLALAGLAQAVRGGVLKADRARVRERLLATLPAVMKKGTTKGKA